MYVSITQLTGSDSGRYRCGLDRTAAPDSYRDFDIIITDGEFVPRVSVTVLQVKLKCSCVHSSTQLETGPNGSSRTHNTPTTTTEPED